MHDGGHATNREGRTDVGVMLGEGVQWPEGWLGHSDQRLSNDAAVHGMVDPVDYAIVGMKGLAVVLYTVMYRMPLYQARMGSYSISSTVPRDRRR
jgi:hypothetical protein